MPDYPAPDRLELHFKDGAFPRLWELPIPPEHLYIEGKDTALALLERLPEDGLAIVGTRSPQPRSRSLVRDWIRELRHSNLIILSGLARGIDAEAHLSAIEAGLPTIAVLGTGLENDYPRENIALRKRIVDSGGLVITEFPPGTETVPGFFLKRNRLIAGWSKATWVVEASFRSGALNTARWARDQHRYCFATPAYPGDPALAGNLGLLDRENALPLWSPATLGHAWPELPSLLASKSSRRDRERIPKSLLGSLQLPLDASDARLLSVEVLNRSAERGGAAVQDLLDWAIAAGWPPQRFFVALQDSLRAGLIADQQGVLVAKNFRIPEL